MRHTTHETLHTIGSCVRLKRSTESLATARARWVTRKSSLSDASHSGGARLGKEVCGTGGVIMFNYLSAITDGVNSSAITDVPGPLPLRPEGALRSRGEWIVLDAAAVTALKEAG